MTPRTRGLIVAALHILLVCGLGGKLLVDRQLRPRVWAEVAPFDPDLPIRGRYVRLQVEADPRGFEETGRDFQMGSALLSAEGGRLIATRCDWPDGQPVRIVKRDGRLAAVLATPVAYFIPEHAADPSARTGLMVEVTLPRKGPPRPIRLGVKIGDRIDPLDL